MAVDPHELNRCLEAVQGYLTLGMVEEAWEELDDLPPDLRSSDMVAHTRIKIYQSLEKWEPARMLAESLAMKSPENADWWVEWAYSLRREQSVAAARGVLWEASMRHPGVAIISYNLACYAAVLGDLDEARKLLDRAIALDSSFRAVAPGDPDLEALFK